MEDLENAWEVLAEPIQTVMRRHGIPDSYEQLKELTRGKEGINRDTLHKFIDGLTLPESEKIRLCKMMPQNYIGDAAALARKIGIEDS
jgi:adenylosuccinate lyase